ncbi:conserved hypothetical protein [Pediculus humanus corporis]|uniref:Lipid droplet-associated hydrolase n=1 Tax=Pediculus humanus subsp. corporis TaxID=121224 RepID=E0VIX5_PEDHC|nr:uncharacterized protein Phum_PHUM235300 [Pediculus humanus corporis]EEB13331.1 conserved hypothetical protein [Pediculus humanus corporis]
MESEFVTINRVPLRIDSWGGYMPSKIEAKLQEKPNELILVIPGNPGVTKFYEKFLNHLYELTKKPIWIMSHGGHDKINSKLPSLKENKFLYNLQGQVEQKDKFIEKYLEGVKLYCVGHSVGCKMLLDLLKKERKSNVEIEKCIMLFPTIERMAEAPNAAYVICYCFCTGIPPNNIPAMMKLVDPHVLSKVFFLADDEMKIIKELDDETLKIYGEKLTLYYGSSDGWTPLTYYRNLREKHKNVFAEVCSHEHTFVLKESKEIASLVNDWLNA